MGRHGVAETLTGALVLVVALGFLVFAVAHSGRVAGSGYPLQARFDHIDGLSVGADVRIAGVKVGTVTGVQVDPKSFVAVVALRVADDIQLPKDSAASIISESLLGGKYISLSPGGDNTDLKPGQAIAITQSSVSLEELLGKFIFSVTTLNSSKDGQSAGAKSDGKPATGDQPANGAAGDQPANGAALAPLSK
jgi:phospholipid/cholesterol/gamma-HCH transport system substrate-binding protein